MKKSRGWLSPSTVLERSQAANSLLPPACHVSPSKFRLKEGGDLQYQERCQKSLKPPTTLKGFVKPSYSPSWESLSSWPRWLQSSSLLLFQPFRLPEDLCPADIQWAHTPSPCQGSWSCCQAEGASSLWICAEFLTTVTQNPFQPLLRESS